MPKIYAKQGKTKSKYRPMLQQKVKLENWLNLQLTISLIKDPNYLTIVNLAKFILSSKTSLANIVKEVYKKQLIDYITNNKNDFIIFMISSLRIAKANYLEKKSIICSCQVSKIDQSNKNDM